MFMGFWSSHPIVVLEQKPLPILVPPKDLKYAQVCKKVAKGRVVEVTQHVVFGDIDEILRLFGANFGNKKWLQRTPAMAQKLTNHIWTLKELLTFRVPVQ
ncbi:hypothetical protein C5S42_04970 [Candidatus Methanomarinus sp.]|nr:hypothetical protein C5S42_04970 [ANME-2 cluster archaeon]